MLDRTRMLVVTAALAAVTPSMAHAQKLGQGGTGVDETTAVPQCQVPLGVAALVEEKAATPADGLSPQLQALMRMAEMQNGGSTARVDALPLVKLMIARSNCFRVADRGEAFGLRQLLMELPLSVELPGHLLGEHVHTRGEAVEFVLPVAKWRGFGGPSRLWDKSYEVIAHSAAIAAVTANPDGETVRAPDSWNIALLAWPNMLIRLSEPLPPSLRTYKWPSA